MESYFYKLLSPKEREKKECTQEYANDVRNYLCDETIESIMAESAYTAVLPRTSAGYEQYKKVVVSEGRQDLINLGKIYLRNESEIVVADRSPNALSTAVDGSNSVIIDLDGSVIVNADDSSSVVVNAENLEEDKNPTIALYLTFIDYCIKTPEVISKFIKINLNNISNEDFNKYLEPINIVYTKMIRDNVADYTDIAVISEYINKIGNKAVADIQTRYKNMMSETFKTDHDAYINQCITTADKADLDKLVSLYDTNKDLDQIAEIGGTIAYSTMAKFKASNDDTKKSLRKQLAEDLESIIDDIVKGYKPPTTPKTNYDYNQTLAAIDNLRNQLSDTDRDAFDIVKRYIEAEINKNGNEISLKYLTNCGFIAPDNSVQDKIDEINNLIKNISKLGNFIRAAVKEGKLPYIVNKEPEDLYEIKFLDTEYKELAIPSIGIDNKCIFGNDLYILVNNPKNNNSDFYPYDMVPFTISDGNFSKCINGITENDANNILKELPVNYSEILNLLVKYPFKDAKTAGIDLADKNQYKRILESVDLLDYNIHAYKISDAIINHKPHIHFISIKKDNKKEFIIEIEYVDNDFNRLLKVIIDSGKRCFSTEMSTGEKEANLKMVDKGKTVDVSKLQNKYTSI